MSTTPRTDAQPSTWSDDVMGPQEDRSTVSRDFARTLERELIAERAMVNWLLGYEGVDWIISAHANRRLKESDSENRQMLAAAMKEGKL